MYCAMWRIESVRQKPSTLVRHWDFSGTASDTLAQPIPNVVQMCVDEAGLDL